MLRIVIQSSIRTWKMSVNSPRTFRIILNVAQCIHGIISVHFYHFSLNWPFLTSSRAACFYVPEFHFRDHKIELPLLQWNSSNLTTLGSWHFGWTSLHTAVFPREIPQHRFAAKIWQILRWFCELCKSCRICFWRHFVNCEKLVFSFSILHVMHAIPFNFNKFVRANFVQHRT